MIFKYRGIDREGNKVSGRLEASSSDEAKKRLKSRGIFYDKVTEASESLGQKLQKLRAREIEAKKLSIISRNLAIYLNSSITILQAIRLLKTQNSETKILDFLTSIETMLDEGSSFYNAIETQTALKLPDFYKQSIKVAEENGVLGTVLGEMATFLLDQDRTSKNISKAMIYPGFIVTIAIIMVSAMLTIVVPKITQMFVQMKQEIPPITQFVIDAGDFLGNYWMVIAIFFTIFLAIFNMLLKTSENFKFSFHLFLLKIPFFGRVVQTSELTRFSYIASVLLKSGVTFVHTIRLAGNTLNNVVLKDKIMNASKLVVEGKKFSVSLKGGFKIDNAFVQAIALGEETSEVAPILDNLASLYHEENQDSISVFLSMLEPMLMLFVGGAIGTIVVAMLLPIFSLNLGGM
jgi:general secretion pathway protein F/type IV pilus assembly protein PilC